MISFEMNDRKKIGLGLTGFGVLFSFLGIIFFFDRGLLAMGNILFLSGLMLTIGLKSTLQFFTKRRNYKGTISFVAGFFLVLIGWAFCGMILEAYGFIVLFSGFWPTLSVFLQRIPIVGWIFRQPFFTSVRSLNTVGYIVTWENRHIFSVITFLFYTSLTVVVRPAKREASPSVVVRHIWNPD